MTEAEERDAFYQAIMDNWDDDTPRLVYADWLDERGDELSHVRAELIRVQCELARYQREKETPPEALQEREKQLQRDIRASFAQRGVNLEGSYGEARFIRGFVEDWGYMFDGKPLLTGAAEDWAALGPLCVDGVPVGSVAVQLASAPSVRYWARYRDCEDGPIGEAACVALFGKGELGNLRRITIIDWIREGEGRLVGNRGMKAIATNSALAKMTHLKLWWCGVGDSGLKSLAKAHHLRAIKRLSLADEFTDEGVAALAESPVLETIEYLHLNGRLTGRCLKHLMASTRLKSLRTLDLSVWTSGTHEHDDLTRLDWSLVFDKVGVTAFINSPLLPQLKVLKLSDCGITPRDVARLAKAVPKLTALEHLSVIGGYMRNLEEGCRVQGGSALKIAERYFDDEDW